MLDADCEGAMEERSDDARGSGSGSGLWNWEGDLGRVGRSAERLSVLLSDVI